MSDHAKFVPESNEIKFLEEQAPWTIIRLENGAEVRIRLNLAKVRSGGFFGKDHPQAGMPSYHFDLYQLLHIEWPDDMKAEINQRRMDMGLEPLRFEAAGGTI